MAASFWMVEICNEDGDVIDRVGPFSTELAASQWAAQAPLHCGGIITEVHKLTPEFAVEDLGQ